MVEKLLWIVNHTDSKVEEREQGANNAGREKEEQHQAERQPGGTNEAGTGNHGPSKAVK